MLCSHRYGEWTVITPATTENEGLQMHACRYCGYEETETIPPLEGNPIPDGSDVGSTVDSDIDSAVDSDVESAVDSGTDSVLDSETDGSDNSVSSIGGADSAIGSMMTGCQAVVGLPMLGMAVLALGGVLLKRKNNNE